MATITQVSRVILKKVLAVETPEVWSRRAYFGRDGLVITLRVQELWLGGA